MIVVAVVTVPANDEYPLPFEIITNSMTETRPLSIYIVDDDEAVLHSTKALLEVKGFNVAIFPSGEEFLAHDLSKYDVCLLLDLQLPRMSGVEVLEELSRRGQSIPTIVMTGGGDAGQKKRALDAGAITVLDKPLAASELVNTLQSTQA